MIEVFNLSKRYRIFYEKSSVAKSLFAWAARKRAYEDLWALREVSFSVEKGESVGVVGRNGSGKTTLLKLLAAVTQPEAGQIKIGCATSALLELGTGFQEELTGRENIFLNGALLGLKRRQIRARFDGIVDFSELEKFIDAPMRTYSAGMWMRLGFALAIHASFEVLLIDEILAVGDISFQQKCFEKFNQLKQAGVTVIFVSHNLEKVNEVCNRAIWLDAGRLKAFEATEKVSAMYAQAMAVCGMGQRQAGAARHGAVAQKRWGSREARITGVYFTDEQGKRRDYFSTGEAMTVNISYMAQKRIENPIFGFGMYRGETSICGPNTKAYGFFTDSIEGEGTIRFSFAALDMLEGEYLVSASIYDRDIYHPYDHQEKAYRFWVNENAKEEKYGLIKPKGRWFHEKK